MRLVLPKTKYLMLPRPFGRQIGKAVLGMNGKTADSGASQLLSSAAVQQSGALKLERAKPARHSSMSRVGK